MSPFKDLSHLPKAEPERADGLLPDAEPRFANLLAEHWLADDQAHPHVRGSDARFWHSDAGRCSRLIAYKAAGIPASDPMELSGINNVRIGSMIHDAWQDAARQKFGDAAQAEVRVFTLDGDGTGRIDLLITGDKMVSVELKTKGGFGYKSSVGKARRGMAAEGPSIDHILQAALNAHAVDADEAVVSYIAKENLSASMSKGLPESARFSADWTFTHDQYEPLAVEELARVKGVLDLLDAGELAARKIPHETPKGAEIVNVDLGVWEQRDADGAIVDTGSCWFCGYCSHRTLCAKTEPGRIAVETAVQIAGVAA